MSAKPPHDAGNPAGRPNSGSGRAASPTTAGPAQTGKEIVGTVIHGKYEVLQLLSQGGMGVVYKARHMALDTLVALKVLLKAEEPGAQQRFVSEARLASKVRHPNTVYISDVGILEDGRAFLEMEFLEGRTLAADLRKGPIEPLRACQIAMQMARGLQAVHDKGIIHRDMKPDNVFLMEQDGDKDFVKIVDFGIAKVTRNIDTPSEGTSPVEAVGDAAVLDSAARSGNYTQPGKVMGTPGYMAPEQLQAMRLDVRVDQYAVGCILYQMIAGKAVFHARGMQQLMLKHMTDSPVPLRKRCPDGVVPESVEKLVMRLLCKDPADRFASMRELEQELQREIDKLSGVSSPAGGAAAATSPRLRSRPPRWPFVAAFVLALLIVGFIGYRFVYLPRSGSGGTSGGMQSKELTALRQRALKMLRDDLRGDVTELRWSALSALAQSRDPELRTDLENALASAEPQTRAQAAAALGHLGDRRATASLLALIDPKVTTHSLVKVAAAGALRQLGDSHGQRFLEQILSSDDAEQQIRAALLFCEQGPPAVKKILTAYLLRTGMPEQTQKDILGCLSRAGDTAALGRLRGQVSEVGLMEQRLSAAVKLAQIGDSEGFKVLRELARVNGPGRLVAARELALLDEPSGIELFRQALANGEAQSFVRQLACDGLGAIGDSSDAWRLEPLLDNPDRRMRQACARAIVQITGRDPGLLSEGSLIWARAAMSDSDALVRESAAAILGDSLSEGAVTLLTGMLKDKEARVRRSVVIALGKRKDEASVRALRTALSDEDRGVRTQSLRSLLRMGEALNSTANRRAAKQLQEALTDVAKGAGPGTPADRALAVTLLMRMGDVSQVKRLREWLAGADAELRRLAVEALPLSVDELTSILKDGVLSVRFAAARKLAEVGKHNAAPVLEEVATRGGPDAMDAYSLLRRLGAQKRSGNPFERLLLEADSSLRLEAVEALAGLPGVEAEPLLVRAARDREPFVRRMVAEVAAELAEKQGSREALSVVQRLASDPHPAVRNRAAALLARLLEARAAVAKKTVPSAALPDGGGLPRGDLGNGAWPELLDGGDAGQEDGGEPTDGDGGPTEPETPDSPGGRGTLIVTAGPGIQFQIDRQPWQAATGKPINLSAGSHTINSLGGVHSVTITADKPTQLKLESSQVEQLSRAGLDSFAKNDYKKAQRQMEKAIALCSRDRDRQHAAVCAALSVELLGRLGQIHERQKEWPQAMTEYQRLLSMIPQARGKSELKANAQQAVERLEPKVGKVVLLKSTKKGCQEEIVWMPPGTHLIKVDAKTEQIALRPRQVVRIGKCK